jgi:hypothetical protein
MNRGERWLTGVAIVGVAAAVLATMLFWALLTAPETASAAGPAGLMSWGRWVAHLARLVAAWL